MKKIVFILVFFFVITFISSANDEIFTEIDHNNNLRLGNDYIVILVNQDENAQGRFAVETTGGAPLNDNDMNKPLIYGRPVPWASYTTVWLNGENYIFGGETGRRAGAGKNYGTVIEEPYVDNNSIISKTQIGEELLIEQILTIVKSSTTGLEDTVQIKYRLENLSQESQKVGLRIMLDTMLGENDGAPFRIGDEAVTTDTLFYKKELPEFWLSFDSLLEPTVTSQGTFKGDGVTSPDQVKLGNWGSMADGVWDFDFNPGDEFYRKGEFEIDSAIAMYWVPNKIEAGESISYITNYGLGGISIVPGILSLGVTSPAEIVLDSPDVKIPVVAYVENTSEITADNVNVSIELPDYLEVDDTVREIGDMQAGGISQVSWNLSPEGTNIPPVVEYIVNVEADNTDSNQVKREIEFIGPPVLESEVRLKENLSVINGKLTPNPFTIESELYNSGGSTLYDVSVGLQTPPGIVLAPGERMIKYPGDIHAGENLTIRWRLEALNIDGKLPLALDINALHGYHEELRFNDLVLPETLPTLFFTIPDKSNKENSRYLSVDLEAENLYDIDIAEVAVDYDSDVLKAVRVSRGDVFIRDGNYLPWNKSDISQEGLIKFEQLIPSNVSSGTLATIHFMILENENFELRFDDEYNFIGNIDESEVQLKNYKYLIGGKEDEK